MQRAALGAEVPKGWHWDVDRLRAEYRKGLPRNPYLSHRYRVAQARTAWGSGERVVTALCGEQITLERDPDGPSTGRTFADDDYLHVYGFPESSSAELDETLHFTAGEARQLATQLIAAADLLGGELETRSEGPHFKCDPSPRTPALLMAAVDNLATLLRETTAHNAALSAALAERAASFKAIEGVGEVNR